MGGEGGRTARYSRGAIAFHWTIALLVIFNLVTGLFSESLFEGIRVFPAHKAVGITVLFLSIARLAWRLTHRPPPFPENLPAWERSLAKAVHRLFYAFMIVVPLAGWMMVSGTEERRPLQWFGLFDIPYLPVSTGVGDMAHEVHEVAALLWAALVALHVAAALRHHFILRDPTLARMLPAAERTG